MSANKPGIVIKDRANRCCKLIDVSIPSDRNTSTKAIEKPSKYKVLEIEVTRMWDMRTETVPIIIGALGLIRKGMDQSLAKVPGAININKLQKITLLGTTHIKKISLHSVQNAPSTPGARNGSGSRRVQQVIQSNENVHVMYWQSAVSFEHAH